jgi:hypothetical protein
MSASEINESIIKTNKIRTDDVGKGKEVKLSVYLTKSHAMNMCVPLCKLHQTSLWSQDQGG